MKSYELTYIISSEITAEEAEAEAKNTESYIQEKEGIILKSTKPFPMTLAYPVKKQGSGFFSILEFQLEPEHLDELKKKLEKNSKIIRSMLIIKKPAKIQKERRTKRKPLISSTTANETEEDKSKDMPSTEKKPSKKVELKEIEEKLEEILSE